MTSLSSELSAGFVTDSVGAWFGAVVHRTSPDSADVTIPLPAPGTGASVLARIIQGVDVAAGVSACLAVRPRTAMTADILLHVLCSGAEGDLRARGSMVRVGRGQAVANVDVFDTRGVLVATATANHGVREQFVEMYLHSLEIGDSFDLGAHRAAAVGPLAEVFLDAAGELPVTALSSNPWAVAQGALMATLVEPAALAAGLERIDDLTLRFVAPATDGPVFFERDLVADRAGSRLLRGVLRDRGTGRVAVLVSATGPAMTTSLDMAIGEGVSA